MQSWPLALLNGEGGRQALLTPSSPIRLGRTDIAGILEGIAGESGDVARSFDCKPYAAGKSMITSE
jgi:hypothetical protein